MAPPRIFALRRKRSAERMADCMAMIASDPLGFERAALERLRSGEATYVIARSWEMPEALIANLIHRRKERERGVIRDPLLSGRRREAV